MLRSTLHQEGLWRCPNGDRQEVLSILVGADREHYWLVSARRKSGAIDRSHTYARGAASAIATSSTKRSRRTLAMVGQAAMRCRDQGGLRVNSPLTLFVGELSGPAQRCSRARTQRYLPARRHRALQEFHGRYPSISSRSLPQARCDLQRRSSGASTALHI